MTDFVLYFLRLGSVGFGGPLVLANHMRQDLVDVRQWVSPEDYQEGLAFAKLSPGPLATQLAMYIGWIRAGILGATLAGVAFILPSFLMVVGLAALYLVYGSLPWIQALFYSIGAAVIGIIANSALHLTQKTLDRDPLLWVLFSISAVTTVLTESEFFWIFIGSGILTLLIKAPPSFLGKSSASALFPLGLTSILATSMTGIHGPMSGGVLAQLGLYFTKVGAVVFGSGLAIVPFLHGGVVQKFQWLNERQFMDAIAIGMITPGPIVITSAFIGYLVAGPLGALISAFAIFFPAYLFVVLLAPSYRRFAQNLQIKAFVIGVTSSAVGGIAGAAVTLGKRAIVDIPTAAIALIAFLVLIKTKKIPEPMIILIAAGLGLLLKH